MYELNKLIEPDTNEHPKISHFWVTFLQIMELFIDDDHSYGGSNLQNDGTG